MPDIRIDHNGLTAAHGDLNQSQRQMSDALTDFRDKLAPHLANTDGDLKEAWNAVNDKVNQTIARANDAMARAVTTLDQIHVAHTNADRQGASMMGA